VARRPRDLWQSGRDAWSSRLADPPGVHELIGAGRSATTREVRTTRSFSVSPVTACRNNGHRTGMDLTDGTVSFLRRQRLSRVPRSATAQRPSAYGFASGRCGSSPRRPGHRGRRHCAGAAFDFAELESRDAAELPRSELVGARVQESTLTPGRVPSCRASRRIRAVAEACGDGCRDGRDGFGLYHSAVILNAQPRRAARHPANKGGRYQSPARTARSRAARRTGIAPKTPRLLAFPWLPGGTVRRMACKRSPVEPG
jgi:hypothetical protein